jgi:replicative DNA helicase
MESIQKTLDRLIPWLEQAHKHPQGVSGLPTSFKALDALSSGWQRGELIVITAPRRMGKAAFVLSMLNNSMYGGGLGTVWFSTNLSTLHLTKMMLCHELKVEMHYLQSGKVDMEVLYEMYEKYKLAGVHFDDSPYLSIDDIDAKINEQFEIHPIDMVIIDNVNQLNYAESNQLKLADKFYQLKTLARKYEIPIIGLLETENQQKDMSSYSSDWLSLSDYEALSKSVDVRIQLYRPEYYKITEFSDKSSTLGIAELLFSSFIGCGTVRFKYNSTYFTFEEIIKDAEAK